MATQPYTYITKDDFNTIYGYTISEEQEQWVKKAIAQACERINAISGNKIEEFGFDNINTLQQTNTKRASSRVAIYMLEGGLDWLRGSTSINAGSVSETQNNPDMPDYIMRDVYDLLQSCGLYFPRIYNTMACPEETCGDDEAIIYGPTAKCLSWGSATATFLKPTKVVSSDGSVTVTNTSTPTEAKMDIKTSVSPADAEFGNHQKVSEQWSAVTNQQFNDIGTTKTMALENKIRSIDNQGFLDVLTHEMGTKTYFDDTYANGFLLVRSNQDSILSVTATDVTWDKKADGIDLKLEIQAPATATDPSFHVSVLTKINGELDQGLVNSTGLAHSVKLKTTWTANATNPDNWDVYFEGNTDGFWNFFTRDDLKITKVVAVGISVPTGLMMDNFENAKVDPINAGHSLCALVGGTVEWAERMYPDLHNVKNIPAAHVGKSLVVKNDRTLDYIDKLNADLEGVIIPQSDANKIVVTNGDTTPQIEYRTRQSLIEGTGGVFAVSGTNITYDPLSSQWAVPNTVTNVTGYYYILKCTAPVEQLGIERVTYVKWEAKPNNADYKIAMPVLWKDTGSQGATPEIASMWYNLVFTYDATTSSVPIIIFWIAEFNDTEIPLASEYWTFKLYMQAIEG